VRAFFSFFLFPSQSFSLPSYLVMATISDAPQVAHRVRAVSTLAGVFSHWLPALFRGETYRDATSVLVETLRCLHVVTVGGYFMDNKDAGAAMVSLDRLDEYVSQVAAPVCTVSNPGHLTCSCVQLFPPLSALLQSDNIPPALLQSII
jgi:hypothetical protein